MKEKIETLETDKDTQKKEDETLGKKCDEIGKDAFIVPEEAAKVIESLPEKDRKIIFKTMCAIEQSSSFKGPLPPPEVLQGYENILPGAFERILSMAEKQQTHRIDIEHKIVYGQINQSKWGQIIGAVLAILFGVMTFVLGYTGHEWLAGVIGTTTIIGLSVIFVLHKVPQSPTEVKDESEEKDED